MRVRNRSLLLLLFEAGIFLSLARPSFAISEFTLGGEIDRYRSVINPSTFPFLKLGYEFNSNITPDINEANAHVYESVGDVLFRISPSHPRAWALSSKNLYWGEKDLSYDSPLRFTYGKRLVGWSRVDSLWNLNEFEPLDSWDRLRPFSTGLTGAFAYSETQKFNFRFFLSYLFLPPMAPNVVIADQKFQAEHPQAISTAPESINILNQPVDVNYTLETPSIHKIIFRPGFAFMMETKRELNLHAKFSYGYLPLNYFPVALKGVLQLPGTLPATIVPRLLHHHLYNTEVSYRLGDSLSWGGIFLIDQPVPEAISADYTTTPLSTQYIFSPWFEIQTAHGRFTLSHIWTSGGLEPDVSPMDGYRGGHLFSSQVFYRSASQLSYRTILAPNTPASPELTAKYIHEYSIDGDWISADFSMKLTPSFTYYVGGDVLSTYKDISADRGAEFLADLRAFGRVRMGVSYVL